jgi:DNA (cytosine-5)-methyltransferase 1
MAPFFRVLQRGGIGDMKKKPFLLDLFCGAGGAARGYAEAGFDVVGVDLVPQPRYPYQFIQADALTYLETADLSQFSIIHASPPCQAYSVCNAIWKHAYPDLFATIRKLLQATGKPYVLENVPGAPIEQGILLCGSMFGLGVLRHRWFESSILLFSPGPCQHQGTVKDGTYSTIAGHQASRDNWTLPQGSRAMQIDWMTAKELTQAIPPAYTRWVGRQLLQTIGY